MVALADTNRDRLSILKKKFDLKDVLATTDYHEILNRPEVDAVMILTPPSSHAEIIMNAINAGKNIFCEKPLALTVDEGVKILQTLSNKNIKLMVGFNYRFIPHFAKMKRFVKKGSIGRIVAATTHFFSRIERPASISGFQFKSEMGGGALFETGCHHIDLLRWMMGEVKAVQAIIWKSVSSLPIDDNALVVLEFASGAKGSVHVSWSTPKLHRVECFGEDGFVSTDLTKPYIELYLQGKSIFKQGNVKVPVGNVEESYIFELRHLVDCILHEKKPLVSAEDGVEALRVVVKSYESAERGSKVTI